MTEPITVQVFDIIGGPLCVSTSDGQRLHDKIAPLLRKETPVVLSFERVEIDVDDPSFGLETESHCDDVTQFLSPTSHSCTLFATLQPLRSPSFPLNRRRGTIFAIEWRMAPTTPSRSDSEVRSNS